MGRRRFRRGLIASGESRISRFEVLEARHHLSASGLASDDVLLAPASDLTVQEGSATAGAGDEAESMAAAANHAVTTDAGVQEVGSIAVNPLDTNHVVIAYVDYALLDNGWTGIGVATSRNGGESWSHSTVPLPSGFDQSASEPTVAFSAEGSVYISFAATRYLGSQPPLSLPDRTDPLATPPNVYGMESNNGIFVSHSDDGGMNWQSPVAVSTYMYDGIHRVPFQKSDSLAIDTFAMLPDGSANPHYGTIYATWTQYYPAGEFPGEPDATGGSATMIATSSDGGQTWQIRARNHELTGARVSVMMPPGDTGVGVPEGFGYQGSSQISIGPEGNVYVSNRGGGIFVVSHSTDGGASFHIPTLENSAPPHNFGLPFLDTAALIRGGLSANEFAVAPSRTIAADPTRPGFYYAAEAADASDISGAVFDAADIVFSHTDIAHTDPGAEWSWFYPFNDDLNRFPYGELRVPSADQFAVQVAVGLDGTIGVVWFDTRRDPTNKRLDVFGAVGTFGPFDEDAIVAGEYGVSPSRNFRVTDYSFNPDHAQTTEANGREHEFAGNGLAMTIAAGAMYVAWTDTRGGNEDVFFSRIETTPLPPAPNDRFEPNDTVGSVTKVGSVLIRELPQLVLEAGESDWFSVISETGQLVITVEASQGASQLQLLLLDANSNPVDFESVELGDNDAVVGRTISAFVTPGETYFVRIHSGDLTADARYDLTLRSLVDLGPTVYRAVGGAIDVGNQALYRLVAPVAGSITADLVANNDFQGSTMLELLDPHTGQVLANGSSTSGPVTLDVSLGQELFLRVSGEGASSGSFELELSNRDQYSGAGLNVFHFPAGIDPNQASVADINGDQIPDVAIANTLAGTVNVLLANGDGTFSAPRPFIVGPSSFLSSPLYRQGLPKFFRNMETGDFNEDGIADIVVANTESADVSILLGRGDGTFAPQRRFDATPIPGDVDVGDVNGDRHVDLIVFGNELGSVPTLAVLIGRGDGTFLPPRLLELPPNKADSPMTATDLDHNGTLDLVLYGTSGGIIVLSGDGKGGFTLSSNASGVHATSTSLLVTDIDGDGKLDILETPIYALNSVGLFRGDGNGSFSAAEYIPAGQGPIAAALVDWGSELVSGDGTSLGARDGRLDLVVANSGLGAYPGETPGPPEIVVLPSRFSADGEFLGFGDPLRIATAVQPIDLQVADFNNDGVLDVGVVDKNEFFVIYNEPPVVPANSTQATARDLGAVVHVVQPALSITPEKTDAWYRMDLPMEVISIAGDQVVDISGGFANQERAGLGMEVIDASGNVLGNGERLRIVARQSETLYVHIFGQADAGGETGIGSYKLVINTLPQVAAVEAHTLLPGHGSQAGGPTTSIVLVFQGDRLDPLTAQDPTLYRVTWFGPDGMRGTDDDQVIPVGMGLPEGMQTAIYDPGSNIDVSSGRSYPTAVRQTVTLLFGEALPAGSYLVQTSRWITSADSGAEESQLLSPIDELSLHSIVSTVDGEVRVGTNLTLENFVRPAGALGDLSIFELGTRFLTQLHNDLGALLDAQLAEFSDQPFITDEILNQIVARLAPALGPMGEPIISLLVIFLDPVSIGLVDPDGNSFTYNLQSNFVASSLPNTFVEVGGNVEVIMIPNPSGSYALNVADVPARARGGVVYLGGQGTEVHSFTESLRAGSLRFSLQSGGLSLTAHAVASLAETLHPAATAVLAVIPPGTSLVTRAPVRFEPPTFRADSASRVLRAISDVATRLTTIRSATSGASNHGSGSSAELDAFRAAWEEISRMWDMAERRWMNRRRPVESADGDLEPAPLFQLLRVLTEIFGNDAPEETAASSGDESRDSAAMTQRDDGANENRREARTEQDVDQDDGVAAAADAQEDRPKLARQSARRAAAPPQNKTTTRAGESPGARERRSEEVTTSNGVVANVTAA